MNAGDAADQVLRQLDKMMRNNERASRDSRLNKVIPSVTESVLFVTEEQSISTSSCEIFFSEAVLRTFNFLFQDEQSSNHLPFLGDPTKKRSTPLDNEDPSNNYDLTSKRVHYGPNNHIAPPVERNDSGKEYVNGVNPMVEQIIGMIGALLAEGERGATSLEVLISELPPDLLADIVITNMKHLPKNPPPLARLGSLSLSRTSDSSNLSQVMAPIDSSLAPQAWVPGSQTPTSLSTATSTSLLEMSASTSLPSDSKRDPRRVSKTKLF